MSTSLNIRTVRPMAIRQQAIAKEKEEKKPRVKKEEFALPPQRSFYICVTTPTKNFLASGIRAKVLLFIRDNPKTTFEEIHEKLGVDDLTARTYVRHAVKVGVVISVRELRASKINGYKVAKLSIAENATVTDQLTLMGT